MTNPAIGQRVVVNGTHDHEEFTNEAGVITRNPSYLSGSHVTVRFDKHREELHDGLNGDDGHHWFFDTRQTGFTITPEQRSTYLNGETTLADILSTAMASRAKAGGSFLLAFEDTEDGDLSSAGEQFDNQRDADNRANELAAMEPGSRIAVLRVVSRHTSQVVVTTEAA